MDIKALESALSGTRFQQLHHFAVIHSTNTYAIEQAQAGVPSGQVYLADQQTAGRGRGGHSWHSSPEEGLYLTALVRPQLHAQDALKLSLATGLAAQQAIQQATGIAIDLRWPNDLVTAPSASPSKKLGGILTESAVAPDGTLRYAAIGIGINLNHRAFPPEVETTATSLYLISDRTVDRSALCVSLLQSLSSEIDLLENDPDSIFPRFEHASSWVRNKHVTVAEDEGYTGITDGLSATGLLRIRTDQNDVREVRHGGVRETPRS